MNKTEQMVMGFQSPAANSNPIPYFVDSCTRSLHSTADSQPLQAIPFQRLDPTPRSLFRRKGKDGHWFSKIACRAAVDCLAMAGCVLSAALATLLFGL